MKRQFFIRNDDRARDSMAAAWHYACDLQRAGKAARVTVEGLQPTRSLEQNALMWSVLGDIARQVRWHVDGQLVLLDPEEWKEILSAGLRKHQRVAQGIEGGFVMLGMRTSRMTVAEMGDLIELAHAFGAQHDVTWSPTSIGREMAA